MVSVDLLIGNTLGTLTLFRMYDRSVSCKCAHVGFQWSGGSLGVLVGCMVSAEAPPSRFCAIRSRPGVVRECSRLSAAVACRDHRVWLHAARW